MTPSPELAEEPKMVFQHQWIDKAISGATHCKAVALAAISFYKRRVRYTTHPETTHFLIPRRLTGKPNPTVYLIFASQGWVCPHAGIRTVLVERWWDYPTPSKDETTKMPRVMNAGVVLTFSTARPMVARRMIHTMTSAVVESRYKKDKSHDGTSWSA